MGAILNDMTSETDEFWVVSDRVLLPQGEAPASIMIKGAYIRRIEPASTIRERIVRSDEALTVFDVAAAPVVPGWVNAHTHLAMAPLRGITSVSARSSNVVSDVFFRIESSMTADDVRAFSRLGAYESALCGGLFVLDHYYFGHAVARALSDVGLTGMVAPTVLDRAGPFTALAQQQLRETCEIADDSTLSQRGIFAALGPHAGDTVSSSLMEGVAELARRKGLAVHLHLAQSFEEVLTLDESRGGFDRAIEELAECLHGCEVVIAHGLHLSRASIELLTARDWLLAYCPYSQMQFGFLGPLRSWLAAGGRVALGTDCVASNDALDVQRELALIGGDAALRTSFSSARADVLAQTGVEPRRAVEKLRKETLAEPGLIASRDLLGVATGATLAGSRETKALSACAPLTVGALANFLVLDEDHPSLYGCGDLNRLMAYGSTSGAIAWGVVAGRRLGQTEGWQRAWTDTLEYRAALKEARLRRDELFRRVGIA